MLRILVVVFILLAAYRIVKARSYKNARKRFADLNTEADARDKIFKDPVCGGEVRHKDAFLLWQDGEIYGFCSKKCMRDFQHEQTQSFKL